MCRIDTEPGGAAYDSQGGTPSVGSSYARCTPYSYSQGSNPSAVITCYDALGGAVNASFSVQWLLG